MYSIDPPPVASFVKLGSATIENSILFNAGQILRNLDKISKFGLG
jgi:hypothetical protein